MRALSTEQRGPPDLETSLIILGRGGANAMKRLQFRFTNFVIQVY